MCIWRKGSLAAAVGTLFCVVLLMTGCGASTVTGSATSNTSAGSSSANGSSSTSGPAAGPASLSFPEQGGSVAEVPSSYLQGVPNRWVLYFHGYNETASTILGGNYATVEAALLDAGYVVIGMNNTTQNCYGDAECSADVVAVTKLYKSELNLQAEPYVLADSMGGFGVLNAISAGVIHPKAVVGWCINTDLAWDYLEGGAVAPITVDYSVSAISPYAVATAGYDPMLSSGAVYANTPFDLWGSYSDMTVSRTVNTDRFAAMVNASGGNAVVNTSSGDHMDASNFDPAAVVAFFDAH